MTTRGIGHAVSALSVFVVLAGLPSCQPAPIPPNIVLIVIDTLRADTLSSYGYERPTSPNIDTLANESVVFNKAFTVGSQTPQSMAALLTGRLPFYLDRQPGCKTRDCAVPWNQDTWFGMQRFRTGAGIGIPGNLDTLAELLARRGFTTAGFITNAYLKTRYHFNQGFAVYEELVARSCSAVNLEVMRWLRQSGETPFFLFVHYIDPHTPYSPPARYQTRFQYERSRFADNELFVSSSISKEIEKLGESEVGAHLRGLYDAEVLYVDDCVGRLMNFLRSHPWYTNTIVALSSDHGEEFFEHGRIGHRARFYDEHIHVPLMVRVPGIEHARIDQLVRHFDIMPTLLDYAGIAKPDGLDAVSLRPLIEGDSRPMGLAVYANYPHPRTRRMYRTDRYKLMTNIGSARATELYDLSEDPGEERNLYSGEPNELQMRLIREMNQLIAKLRAESIERSVSARGPVDDIDAVTRSQLQKLGYLD